MTDPLDALRDAYLRQRAQVEAYRERERRGDPPPEAAFAALLDEHGVDWGLCQLTRYVEERGGADDSALALTASLEAALGRHRRRHDDSPPNEE